MATLTEVEEETLIREKIAEVELPVGVRLKSVETYDTWTGEPAWRIFLAVKKSIPLTKQRVAALSQAKNQIRDKILSTPVEKYPFVRFLETR